MDPALSDPRPNIVFIGGTGRSGTNITKDMLSRHPQVATLPFEYRFIIDPDGIVDFYSSYAATWSPYLADRRLKRLEKFLAALTREPKGHRLVGNVLRRLDARHQALSPRQYHGWHLEDHLPNFGLHTRSLLDELRSFSFPAYWHGTESYTRHPHLYHAGPKSRAELAPVLGRFVCRVVDDYLRQQGKTCFVEDNTWNILFARELLELVPHARILHVHRDPRDVVSSFMQQRWSPHDAAQAATWYRSIIEHWLRVRADLPSGSYHEFSLEELVDETERVVSEVCAFAGIPPDPALLGIDLGRSHRGRWRQDLSARDQQIVADILGDLVAYAS